MLPPILIQNFRGVLDFFTLVIRWIQLRRRRFSNQEFTEIIQIILNYMHMAMLWMELLNLIRQFIALKRKRRLLKPHLLLPFLGGYRAHYQRRDIWALIEQNWTHFFWLTGEIPQTLQIMVNRMDQIYRTHLTPGRWPILDFRNQVLLTMIWLRRYPSMDHISMEFGIPVSCTHRIIHRCLRLLHAYIVPRYIRWHTMNEWRNLAGLYPEWPRVVAILDCTPFRISRPRGPMQRFYYRRDRHCFFLNWVVIVDTLGFVILSRPGFIGRTHDSVCFGNVHLPVLPQGLQIMADQGFAHQHPIIVLPKANQQPVPANMRRTFRSRRSMIERCFGILKNSYRSVGTLRYRSRKYTGPIVCNLTCGLYNRRKLLFHLIRQWTGYMYMHR